MFSNFFRNSGKVPAGAGGKTLRQAVSRGDKFGEVTKHEDSESMLVNVTDMGQIDSFLNMCIERIGKLVEEGFGYRDIKNSCIIDTPNPELGKKVGEIIDFLIYAALVSKKLGRGPTPEEKSEIDRLGVVESIKHLQEILEDEDYED